MKITHALVILIFILALIGHADRSEANDINAFVQACLSAYNWEEPLCKCAAEKADERLTPNGFAFLVAVMNEDMAKAEKLRGQMDMNEKADAGMFFVNTPQECGEALQGN
jgi:hypothetical protein